MAHPKMYDANDPVLGRVREAALGFPGAAEKISHGRPTFYTTKVFCYYGGSLKVEGTWTQHPQSVLVLAEPSEREALRQLPHSYIPGYLGPSGWTGIDLGHHTDWGEIRELLTDSYRLTAPATLRARLGA